ncbi:hypothetical protein I5E72_04885 [Proteus terrae]|nr:hypothetical protein [Proteus terrae]MBG5949075.1 hypothetical protein [Proteus terrae]
MNKKASTVSIIIDTSELEEKITKIISLLPSELADKFLSELLNLDDNIVFSDYSGTVQAGMSNNLVYFLDFNASFYSKILSTARTFNTDVTTHNSVP